MTRQQRLLAKIRAWIDRRLPRDVLRITVYGVIQNDEGRTVVKTLVSVTHMEAILQCKYGSGSTAYQFDDVMITLSTEHLSV